MDRFGLLLAAPARAQPIWTWSNQYGSVLAVNSHDQSTGAISGTYRITQRIAATKAPSGDDRLAGPNQ